VLGTDSDPDLPVDCHSAFAFTLPRMPPTGNGESWREIPMLPAHPTGSAILRNATVTLVT